jgi:hypothetical protein
MHRIVPVIGLSSYVALHAFAGDSSAISSEARTAHDAVEKVIDFAERSEVLFGTKAAALSQLTALVVEHSQAGWDGEDAKPIDPNAARLTRLFVRVIPEDIPLPEFSAEPDGAISLDWMAGRDRAFSISVGPRDRLAFAWLDGADRGHGAVFFDGKQIPPRILIELRQMAETYAGLRAA